MRSRPPWQTFCGSFQRRMSGLRWRREGSALTHADDSPMLSQVCGLSSVGRASASQAEGRRFETGSPLRCVRPRVDATWAPLQAPAAPTPPSAVVLAVACRPVVQRGSTVLLIPGDRRRFASGPAARRHRQAAKKIRQAGPRHLLSAVKASRNHTHSQRRGRSVRYGKLRSCGRG